jgi:hypothetical protein
MSDTFCLTNFEGGCSPESLYGPVPSWFDYLSTLNFVFWGGIVGTVLILSNSCRSVFRNTARAIDEKEEELPYEMLYEDELNEAREANKDMELTEEQRKQLHLSTVVEETPRGKVVMFYDNSTESFWWFADSKDVPYKYLEAVCRRYVTVYDCVSLYNGTIDELKRVIEERKAANEEDANNKENKAEEEESVFANLKTYNKRTGHDNEAIILDNTNRYSYRGKLEDWEELQKERERTLIPQDNPNEKLDFSAFKKMQEQEEVKEE